MSSSNPYKPQATRLNEFLAANYGLRLPRSAALEAIARVHGKRYWNELATVASAASGTPDASQAAPVYDGDIKATRALYDCPADILTLLQTVAAQGVTALHLRPDGRMLGSLHGNPQELCSFSAADRTRWLAQLGFRKTLGTGMPLDWAFEFAPGRVLQGATIPCADDDYIILALRQADPTRLSLDDLGMTELPQWRNALAHDRGLCLVAGATGTGKTTTLMASLSHLRAQGRSVCSITEELWWGQLESLGTTQALAYLLALNVQTYALWELRTPDTVALARALCMSGKQVLGTLHTVSQHGLFRRLQDLGWNPEEVRQHLRGGCVQMLARVTCIACAGRGCALCHQNGATGRTLLSEVAHYATAQEAYAASQGKFAGKTLVDDALLKVRNKGLTLDEVARLFGVPTRWQ